MQSGETLVFFKVLLLSIVSYALNSIPDLNDKCIVFKQWQ